MPEGIRVFVATCTAGCQWHTKQGLPTGPRRLEAFELAAHDDRHVSDAARVLVRMLRDVEPGVRDEALDYFTRPFPVYAQVEGGA